MGTTTSCSGKGELQAELSESETQLTETIAQNTHLLQRLRALESDNRTLVAEMLKIRHNTEGVLSTASVPWLLAEMNCNTLDTRFETRYLNGVLGALRVRLAIAPLEGTPPTRRDSIRIEGVSSSPIAPRRPA